jgi:4a-hydroxytetrahydrobiopterin dehydratase
MTTSTSRLAPVDLASALSDLPDVHRGAAGQLVVRLQALTFPDAVELIRRVAETAEELDHHPDVDLRFRTVTFTLSTHSAGGITRLDVDLAARILEHAHHLSARRLPAPDRVEIAIDTQDADALRPFWRVGLGYVEKVDEEGGRELHHPGGAGAVVRFQQMDPPRPGRGRVHLDVYVPAEVAERRVSDTLAAGGHLVTNEYAPDWWVLADPEGNELCVCRE